MEKQQTALTELIEWINFIEHKYGGDGVSHIKTKATELLETEKQQIIKAVLDGSYGNPIMTKEIATKYYNETLKH